MRRIRQLSLRLPTLDVHGTGGKKAQQHLVAKSANAAAKLSFPEHWNKTDVRGALFASHSHVCAYCERALPDNDRGDVEHFRPKGKVDGDVAHGGYWWLAYEFSNYLLICSACNRVYKRDRFPLRSRATRRTYATRGRLWGEARVLLHPITDSSATRPIEAWFEVDLASDICPIRPASGLSRVETRQVDDTLDFFRINRSPRLVRARIEKQAQVSAALRAGDVTGAQQLAIRFQPQSLVARQVLLDAGQPLPDEDRELQWLTQELAADLHTALRLLRTFRDDRKIERDARELRWALAVLCFRPPVGTTATAIDTVTRLGLMPSVSPLVAIL